jgi:hypothetical protein
MHPWDGGLTNTQNYNYFGKSSMKLSYIILGCLYIVTKQTNIIHTLYQ